jgi:glycosyltransferase involved in cell wall biosynthesis
LAVVIPAYNAAGQVGAVVAGVLRAVPDAQVLVVDDGSSDDTAAIAQTAGAAVALHERNLGKGSALATGLAAALALAPTCIVTLDADGQHPPECIPLLVDALLSGSADLVIGARPRDPAHMPPHRRISNWLSSALVSRALGVRVPDSQSGFRAMRPTVAAAVRPAGSRYEFETEFLFQAAWRGFRLAAVPVPTVYNRAPSYFRHIADTMRLAGVFLRHWRAVLVGGGPRKE